MDRAETRAKLIAAGVSAELLPEDGKWNLGESEYDVKLTGKDLEGADFSDADLGGVIFTRANLRHANFRGANVTEAEFNHAYLAGAIFEDANCSRAEFDEARLGGATFRRAQCEDAVFTKASLGAVKFVDADLTSATFHGADLLDTDFTRANLERANLSDVRMVTGHQLSLAKGIEKAFFSDFSLAVLACTLQKWRAQQRKSRKQK